MLATINKNRKQGRGRPKIGTDDREGHTIRAESSVWEAIRRLAKQNRRSLNAEVVVAMERHIQSSGEVSPPEDA